MYITRFSRINNAIEDYAYNTVDKAEQHLKLFTEDDSGLYRNIAVIDCVGNRVITILPFENGHPQKPISEGDIVRLDPRFSTPAERKYLYCVTNLNEATSKVIISCLNSGMSIPSSETVGLEMITFVSKNPLNEESCTRKEDRCGEM